MSLVISHVMRTYWYLCVLQELNVSLLDYLMTLFQIHRLSCVHRHGRDVLWWHRRVRTEEEAVVVWRKMREAMKFSVQNALRSHGSIQDSTKTNHEHQHRSRNVWWIQRKHTVNTSICVMQVVGQIVPVNMESEYEAPLILNLGTGWVVVVSLMLQPLWPEERTRGVHWLGCWTGPTFGPDTYESRKYLLPCRKPRSWIELLSWHKLAIFPYPECRSHTVTTIRDF
jgi:hypothetical protein